jgi:5-formyltetrahydrofolate cyclo-ligase
VKSEKNDIRSALLNQRKCLDSQEVTRGSTQVCTRLLALAEVRLARRLVLYAAFANEIDLRPVCDEWQRLGREFYLPRFNPQQGGYELAAVGDLKADTVIGAYGILEPGPGQKVLPKKNCDDAEQVWLIPGVGFDEHGQRLGRGAGYYDRLLETAAGIKIGVAYEWQVKPAIPAETFDVKMNVVVTDKRVRRF